MSAEAQWMGGFRVEAVLWFYHGRPEQDERPDHYGGWLKELKPAEVLSCHGLENEQSRCSDEKGFDRHARPTRARFICSRAELLSWTSSKSPWTAPMDQPGKTTRC